MTLNRHVGWIVGVAMLGAVTGVGCGGGSANHPPPATASTTPVGVDDASDGLVDLHRHHHHGGVTLFIAMSLDTLGVSPAQRDAVEKIRRDLHARMEPAHVAEQTLFNTLADGVAAGAFDATKVGDAVTQLSAAAAAVHPAAIDALNQLHAVLTPEQRAALVDKVESHWEVWQKANAAETGAAKAEDGHLAHLAGELGLAPDQVDKIRATLNSDGKPPAPLDVPSITAHIRAFSDSFRADTFDAKTLTTASDANARMVGWGAALRVQFVEAVSASLTPDQRTTFAQMLRDHGSQNPSAEGA